MVESLKSAIRDIPDFPKKGILFRDITTLLKNAKAFHQAVDYMAHRYIDENIQYIVGIEARGFILGSALAYRLGKGIVLVRKPGKLPSETIKVTYELEYGTDSLEIQKDALKKDDNVLICDDVLATGGTVRATIELIEKLGARIVECAFLAEITALGGREKLKDYKVFSLLQY
ncbi:MAG: adenine phosphoribosyltransferase [Dictyoglomus thermophilum]|nr:adenine phosphoribosyltransferase [Dictyoglomus thermophilum]MCX7721097.1 adenine phosphoribosyltransferase [Dictyoglomus thermophilum]